MFDFLEFISIVDNICSSFFIFQENISLLYEEMNPEGASVNIYYTRDEPQLVICETLTIKHLSFTYNQILQQ